MPENEAEPVIRDHRKKVVVRDHRGEVIVRDHRGEVIVRDHRGKVTPVDPRGQETAPAAANMVAVAGPSLIEAEIVHEAGVPRDQITVPVSPSKELSDTLLYEDAANPALRYYLPRYRIAEQLVSGRRQFRLVLEQGQQGGRLVVHLEKFPEPEIAQEAGQAQELAHDVAVALAYRVQSDGVGSGEKELVFQEVTTEEGGLIAVLEVSTLSELTQLYQAMTVVDYQSRLVIHRAITVAAPLDRVIPIPDTPVQIADEDCIPFDFQRAEVQQVNGRWKVVVGSMWLLDFEGSQSEANQALQIIQHYQLNQQCFVGRPQPSLEYFLANGRPPSGAMVGEDCIGFNLDQIEVVNINGRWKIVEGSHWIMDFEGNEHEARKAFEIIKAYGFTHTCYVGRPNPSMRYLRR
ncbi:MAG: hypothetical protein IT328_14080 [Caldilineaceae bacterium]|nr:hypothetical protein [Caldilineaceae bacterium]